MPMERAVPETVFTAASTESVFRSANFLSAISLTCSLVILPAGSRPGFLEALVSPMAFLIMAETGGSLVIKEKVRSS